LVDLSELEGNLSGGFVRRDEFNKREEDVLPPAEVKCASENGRNE